MTQNSPAGLPPLDPDAAAHLQTVQRHLAQRIQASADGFLPFESWMHEALYAPALGYYTAGSAKLGGPVASHGARAPAPSLPEGDFTTAPQLTPLYGQTLAAQVAQILTDSASSTVLEIGAGSGALAGALIPALIQLGIRPRYQILDVSPDLRQRQQNLLAGLQADIQWLDTLPQEFTGAVIANEVLDAMPVTLFRWDETGQLMELGVRLGEDQTKPAKANTKTQAKTHPPGQNSSQNDIKNGHKEAASLHNFVLAQRPASAQLQASVSQRMPPLPGYSSEINLQAQAWVRQLGSWLTQGAALLIDYGFPQREYYHPQRAQGTLMCHFRHHAHADPLLYPGLQDITAHIDFTAMADAALEGGLDVLGYTSQARFLMNAGLLDRLTQLDAQDTVTYTRAVSAVQKLLSEAEMGELFKVLAVGKGLQPPLLGFTQGDRRSRL